MSEGTDPRGEWTILVCEHGFRVQWMEHYNGFLHMDSGEATICESVPPATVQVVPASLLREVETERDKWLDAYERERGSAVTELMEESARRVRLEAALREIAYGRGGEGRTSTAHLVAREALAPAPPGEQR